MTDDTVQPLKSSRLPLSSQAQQYLRTLIDGGTYQPGGQLPSENELATQLGISRPTLREALRNLEQQGIIVRKHGVGTFVTHGGEGRLDSGLERLESIGQLAAHQGLRLSVDALKVGQETADRDMADTLQVAPGTLLTSVARVILADAAPIAYLFDIAPAHLLAPTDVTDTFNGSVLDLLRHKATLHITQAVANIVAVNADAYLSRKLCVKPRQALLLLEETLHDDKGQVLEFSRNYFHPSFFRFRVVRR
jgi:GntR family transcriptional regulator